MVCIHLTGILVVRFVVSIIQNTLIHLMKFWLNNQHRFYLQLSNVSVVISLTINRFYLIFLHLRHDSSSCRLESKTFRITVCLKAKINKMISNMTETRTHTTQLVFISKSLFIINAIHVERDTYNLRL